MSRRSDLECFYQILEELEGKYNIGIFNGYLKKIKMSLDGLIQEEVSIRPTQLLIFPTDFEYKPD